MNTSTAHSSPNAFGATPFHVRPSDVTDSGSDMNSGLVPLDDAKAPLRIWFLFMGVPFHRFWEIEHSWASFRGVALVSAFTVMSLMLTGVIKIPVALSMTAGLLGGWLASSSGGSLAFHGWKAAVVSTAFSLGVFFTLSGLVHLVRSDDVVVMAKATATPMALPIKSDVEHSGIASYIAALPRASRSKAGELEVTIGKIKRSEISRVEDPNGLESMGAQLGLREYCLIETFEKRGEGIAAAQDIEKLHQWSPMQLQIMRQVRASKSYRPKSHNAANCRESNFASN